MTDIDTENTRPEWAHDALNDADIAFVNGYIDAIGWMPTADPNELVNLLGVSLDGRVWFELMEDHPLARYKGWVSDAEDGMVGIYGAAYNKCGVEIGYSAGISAALRIHRPELDREARKSDLRFKRERVRWQLADQQADLDRIDADLAALDELC